MPRIILISGKGGVGKTTVAAATGLSAARQGHRTLVMSLDLAHSLSDSFDLDRSLFDQNRGRPLAVAENLEIQEIDVQEELERFWGDVFRYVAGLYSSAGLDDLVADELAIAPGMEDIVALMYLNQYITRGSYDVIVVDCPPTSESIRFVSISTSLRWYMRKRFNFDRKLMKLARPMANRFTELSLPDDDYFAALERLYAKLEGIDRLLVDPSVTTVRLVTNAEKMVVRETQRAFMYFSMYGVVVDRVIINRLLPAEGYFSRWAQAQAAYSAEIQAYFNPVETSTVPLFPNEVIGLSRLGEMAKALYADRDGSAFSRSSPTFSFIKVGEAEYRLELEMPFTQKDEIEVTREGDSVAIRVGSFKRHILLPRKVARLNNAAARLRGSTLTIPFVEEVRT